MFLFLYVSVIMFILYYIYMPHMNSFTTLGWKSVSSLGFVILGAYLFSLAPAVSYRQYLLLGLLLGAIGDVFLALPYCYPKFEKQYFLGGLTAFLFGHLAYIAASYHTTLPITILLAVIAITVGCIMIGWLQQRVDFQGMTGAVMLYASIIMFMELQALTWLFSGSFGLVLNLGSLCFVLSDLILVFIIFGNADRPAVVKANLSFYYFAQMAILTTMMLSK